MENYCKLLFVARNPNTPPEILAKLAAIHKDVTIVCSVAQNPNTSSKTLVELATDSRASVICNIAENPNTPPEILTKLANHENKAVVWRVASNKNAPLEILTQLANHETVSIVSNIARNPSTPKEVLLQLTNHNNVYILDALSKNPNVSADILICLFERIKNNVCCNYIAENIAKHPNAPKKLLQLLLDKNDSYITNKIINNPNVTKNMLKQVLENKMPSMSKVNKDLKLELLNDLINELNLNNDVKAINKSVKINGMSGRLCSKCNEFDPYANLNIENFICYRCK